MVRYTGRFVVDDALGNKKYLCDMFYHWAAGDDLSGFVLLGTTLPTLTPDGKIKLYDNTGGAASSYLTKDFPSGRLGNKNWAMMVKLERMADDTSTSLDDIDIRHNSSLSQGHIFLSGSGFIRHWWVNDIWAGAMVTTPEPVPPIGRHTIAMLLSPEQVILVYDGKNLSPIPKGFGTGALTNTPLVAMNKGTPAFMVMTDHLAGQVSHIQVSEIKCGYIVGGSSP